MQKLHEYRRQFIKWSLGLSRKGLTYDDIWHKATEHYGYDETEGGDCVDINGDFVNYPDKNNLDEYLDDILGINIEASRFHTLIEDTYYGLDYAKWLERKLMEVEGE